MSKIVILSAQLGAPQVVNEMLHKLATANPALADWVRQFDSKPVIKECVQSALNILIQESDIKLGEHVEDYYGNKRKKSSLNGRKYEGVLKTSQYSKGMGIFFDDQYAIRFEADDYQSSWKREISRLQNLFQDAFLAEVTNSILQIIGYNTQVTRTATDTGEKVYMVEGVKE